MGIVVALVALAVAFLSLWQDRGARDQQTRPDLTVVLFKATVEDGIAAERTGPELGDIAPIEGGLSGPAVTISVLNSGEQPGLLVDIEVAVRELWSLDSCWAAGGTEVTADYDVSLPADLDPAALPRVLHAPAGFEVAGKDVDTFALTVGGGTFAEGSWPLLYSVDVTLVERSGTRVPAGSAVLMDLQDVRTVDDIADYFDGDVSSDARDCVERNRVLLTAAAAAGGSHSPALDELNEVLQRALEPGSVPTPSATSEPLPLPGEDAVGTWIVHLRSIGHDDATEADAYQARETQEQQLGLPVSVLDSSDFDSLYPGFWVLYHAAGFQDGQQAAAVCATRAPDAEGDCYGRFLSFAVEDRPLRCRPADSDPATHCRRQ